MEKICSFINTPKKNGMVQRKIPVHAAESSKAKPVKLCPTRWVERHESVMVVVELHGAVYYILQEISTWKDRDASSSAMILMNSILETLFIISLYNLKTFFSYRPTLPLSKALQAADCDLVPALNHILDIVAQLKDVIKIFIRIFSAC
jgi:hypothetical protein